MSAPGPALFQPCRRRCCRRSTWSSVADWIVSFVGHDRRVVVLQRRDGHPRIASGVAGAGVVGVVGLDGRNRGANVGLGGRLVRAIPEAQVRGDRDRQQDAEDDDDNEELDERETALLTGAMPLAISLSCMVFSLLPFVRDVESSRGVEARVVRALELLESQPRLAYGQAPETMSAPGPALFQILPPTVL